MSRNIDDWLDEIAEAGERLTELRAIEGAAGNISLFLPRETTGLDRFISERMPRAHPYALPENSPTLPDGALLITGTGRRLRDARRRLDSVLCVIVIDGGETAWLHRSVNDNVEPTSEIDSHAGIHAAALGGNPGVHSVIHAQPPRLTWLSHIPEYREQRRLNRQLLRWQPETIVMLPDGIDMLQFETPGTPAQGTTTAAALQRHRLVVWAKHGVVARSSTGPLGAVDLIDYAEAAASYEVTDLLAGRPADGLSLSEIRAIASRFGVSAALLDTLPEDVLR